MLRKALTSCASPDEESDGPFDCLRPAGRGKAPRRRVPRRSAVRRDSRVDIAGLAVSRRHTTGPPKAGLAASGSTSVPLSAGDHSSRASGTGAPLRRPGCLASWRPVRRRRQWQGEAEVHGCQAQASGASPPGPGQMSSSRRRAPSGRVTSGACRFRASWSVVRAAPRPVAGNGHQVAPSSISATLRGDRLPGSRVPSRTQRVAEGKAVVPDRRSRRPRSGRSRRAVPCLPDGSPRRRRRAPVRAWGRVCPAVLADWWWTASGLVMMAPEPPFDAGEYPLGSRECPSARSCSPSAGRQPTLRSGSQPHQERA